MLMTLMTLCNAMTGKRCCHWTTRLHCALLGHSENLLLCRQLSDTAHCAGVSPSGQTEQASIGSLESSTSSWPGGLPDDMHSATTGLLTMEGASLPDGASPQVRPLIIPEVRRPSLRAGSGTTDYAAPHSRTDHRLSRRPSFVEGGSRENSLDAEFPALGNLEGRHAAQTYRWQQQHFGEGSGGHHHHS